MTNKDKVRGLFLGTAIGDAMGCPVEGWTHEQIKEKYGKITQFHDPKGHKYHDGMRAGATTDDTQLTISVAEGLIESQCLDMDVQARHHVEAFKKHTSGWGRTTREAIEKLASGTHWSESGIYSATETDEGIKKPAVRGFGNGVAMKAAPIGAFLASISFDWKAVTETMARFSGMTHPTSMAVSSCLAHAFASFRCMVSEPESFSVKTFIATVVNASELGKAYYKDTYNNDDITERFRLLDSVDNTWTTAQIVENFGKGTFYVYNSLPFTYAFFVKDPTNIEMLYECASAGGDTDSNASMLGALQGALNGTSFFPKHLIDGLCNKQELIKLADAFSERFKI